MMTHSGTTKIERRLFMGFADKNLTLLSYFAKESKKGQGVSEMVLALFSRDGRPAPRGRGAWKVCGKKYTKF